MAEVVKSLEAKERLKQIVEYIAKDNLAASIRWLDEIEAIFALLAEQPGIGQRVQTRRFGIVRRHVVGNYLVYYQPITGGVEILLVSHGARDQRRLI
jgi:toxin ParE1/3/4